jgi:hypothetical protein
LLERPILVRKSGSDIEDHRHGPVVCELELHPRSEDARLDRNAQLAERVAEAFVERLRDVARSGVREVGSSSSRSSTIAEQRDLADREQLPSGLEQAAVEAPGIVLEDPEPRDLRREPLGA